MTQRSTYNQHILVAKKLRRNCLLVKIVAINFIVKYFGYQNDDSYYRETFVLKEIYFEKIIIL